MKKGKSLIFCRTFLVLFVAFFWGGILNIHAEEKAWVKYANNTLTFQYGEKESLGEYEYWLNDGYTLPNWCDLHASVYKVVFDNSFATVRPTSCYAWFAYCASLTDIEGIENLNTSEVKVMTSMFQQCSNLASLDLSNFDTGKVENMNFMFKLCENLKSIRVSDKFVGMPELAEESFVPSSSVFYCSPSQYTTVKTVAAFSDNTVKPYVNINSQAEYGTLCVPVGSKLAEGSFSGFDKLYTINSADKSNRIITMAEATSIEPGVAYVYHRNLPADATESIITFYVDADASTVTTPNDKGMLKGTFESITAPGSSYILQTDGMFHPVAEDNSTLKVGAYRAYLNLPEIGGIDDAKAFRMVFSDSETTGIGGIVDNAEVATHTECFDLMGRKVSVPKAGNIYIVNGKKVVYNK